MKSVLVTLLGVLLCFAHLGCDRHPAKPRQATMSTVFQVSCWRADTDQLYGVVPSGSPLAEQLIGYVNAPATIAGVPTSFNYSTGLVIWTGSMQINIMYKQVEISTRRPSGGWKHVVRQKTPHDAVIEQSLLAFLVQQTEPTSTEGER